MRAARCCRASPSPRRRRPPASCAPPSPTETAPTCSRTCRPGPYRLEVSLQGFRTYVQTGLVLHGRRDADGQRRPGARLARGDGHGRRGGAARRRAQRRHQRGRRERAHRRAAAAGAAGHRPARALGRGGADGAATAADSPGGVKISVAGGLRDRRRVHPRRRDAQQPAGEREPAAAVPGRAAGVPRRDERPDRAERRASRRRRSTP